MTHINSPQRTANEHKQANADRSRSIECKLDENEEIALNQSPKTSRHCWISQAVPLQKVTLDVSCSFILSKKKTLISIIIQKNFNLKLLSQTLTASMSISAWKLNAYHELS